jgi:hypothetical protein
MEFMVVILNLAALTPWDLSHVPAMLAGLATDVIVQTLMNAH